MSKNNKSYEWFVLDSAKVSGLGLISPEKVQHVSSTGFLAIEDIFKDHTKMALVCASHVQVIYLIFKPKEKNKIFTNSVSLSFLEWQELGYPKEFAYKTQRMVLECDKMKIEDKEIIYKDPFGKKLARIGW